MFIIHRKRRLCRSLLLALTLSLLFCLPAAAAAPRIERTLPTVRQTRIDAYPTVPIHTAVGRFDGRLIGDTTYIGVRALAAACGDTVRYDASQRCLTVTGDALTLSVTDGEHIVYANGRPLFSEMPAVILSDGRMYVPVRTMAKVYGLSVRWNGATRSVTLHGTPTPLRAAEQVYRADEVLWLSRIISAESRGEPLLGQIGVGCVVLNRTRHASYPSTIYGVIFDRTGGTQFTPAACGTVYAAPTASATLAAKICLEGYTLSEQALFFLEPNKSTSAWVPTHRRYLFTVGHHDFYA